MATPKKAVLRDAPRGTTAENDEGLKAPDTAVAPGAEAAPQARQPSSGDEPAPDLAEALAAKSREAQENYDRMLRVSAEFENYKKRMLREWEDQRKYANENLLRELLPVVDSLERALAVEVGGEVESGLRAGIELTLKEMLKVLERFAVRPIEAEGQPFDPNFHQAMMQEETDQMPENTVLREFQRGYTIHDRLLRPSMVIVAKAAAGGQAQTPAEAHD